MTELDYQNSVEILVQQRNAAMDEIVRMGVIIKAKDRMIKALTSDRPPVAPDAPETQR